MWSRSTKPRAARAPYPGCPYSRGRSLPLCPPQAIVGPRPQLKERVDMARPRSVVDAVEGESRCPRIDLDWGTGQRHRRHLHETVLRTEARSGLARRSSQSAPGPHPPPLVRDASPRGRPRHPHAPGAAGAPRRQPTMIYTHVRNRRPATGRSTADRMCGPMSRLAALRGICSGIGCSALQPIRSGEGRSGQGQRAATKGPGSVRHGSPPSHRHGMGSQGLPYYAGQPIQWPNSS
jgi:hypothetical protein